MAWREKKREGEGLGGGEEVGERRLGGGGGPSPFTATNPFPPLTASPPSQRCAHGGLTAPNITPHTSHTSLLIISFSLESAGSCLRYHYSCCLMER